MEAWQRVALGDEFRLHPDVALRIAQVDPPWSLVVRGGVAPDGRATLDDPTAPYDFTRGRSSRGWTGTAGRLVVRERYGCRTLMRVEFRKGHVEQNVDLSIVRKNGEKRIINCSFSLLSGADRGGLVSFRDVTEARETDAELVKTKRFLESLIEASVDAIVAADMHGTIILFNSGAERIYGYKASDVIHKMSVKALYPGNGAREIGRMLASERHGGIGRLEPIRIEVVNRTGQTFPISLSAAVIHEGGKPAATFGIFTDLRERLRVEEQLAQAQEKLAVSEKNAVIAEVAGATAHELNQPLTSVMGYAELLRRKLEDDSPGRHAADVIYRESERMADIVRKIGKLTHYETKAYVGQQKIIDLDKAAESIPPEPERRRG